MVQGAGFKAGPLELHPGITFRGGYDTNIFRGDGDVEAGGQDIIGAGIFRITPELYISTQSAKRALEGEGRGTSSSRVRFNLGLSGGPVHYTDAKGDFRDPATGTVGEIEYSVPQLPDAWEWGANALLQLLPDRANNLELGFGSQRTVTPFTASTGDAGDFTVMTARPSIRLNLGSDSRVFTGFMGYAPTFTDYTGDFEYLQNFNHELSGGTAWAFLPSTALLYEINVGLQDYRKEISEYDQAALNDPANTAGNTCSTPTLYSPSGTREGCPGVRVANSTKLKNRLGLNGAITNTASLRALVGYVALFLEKEETLLSEKDGVVGDLTFIQTIASRHRLEAGYVHDVIPSAAGSYVLSDRVFAKGVLNIGERLILSLEGAFSHLRYGPIILTNGLAAGVNGTDDRSDNMVNAILHGEYGFTEWLSVVGDITAATVMTDFEYNNTVAMNAPDPAGYTQFSFFGGMRAHY